MSNILEKSNLYIPHIGNCSAKIAMAGFLRLNERLNHWRPGNLQPNAKYQSNGEFSTVYKEQRIQKGTSIAVLRRHYRNNAREAFQLDLQTLHQICNNCAFLHKMLGDSFADSDITNNYIDCEFLEKGPLSSFIYRFPNFTENIFMNWGVDILHGLEFLNVYCNLIHLNLSPDSILLGTCYEAIITDFSYARQAPARRTKGFQLYGAPEQTNRNTFYANYDCYSLGLILYEILNRDNLRFSRFEWLRVDCANVDLSFINSKASPSGVLKCLLLTLCEKDQNIRPSPSGILDLPFMQDLIQNANREGWIRTGKKILGFSKDLKKDKLRLEEEITVLQNISRKKENTILKLTAEGNANRNERNRLILENRELIQRQKELCQENSTIHKNSVQVIKSDTAWKCKAREFQQKLKTLQNEKTESDDKSIILKKQLEFVLYKLEHPLLRIEKDLGARASQL